VTALYPFVAPALIDDEVLDRVRRTVASFDAFTCELTAVCEFPGVVWLMPSPDEPFRELTTALWAQFPDHPPYGGFYPDSQPHLTVGLAESEDVQQALKSDVLTAFAGSLPITCRIDELSLFTSDDAGMWTRRERFSLRPARSGG
jgi:2'-5' RNA ligase